MYRGKDGKYYHRDTKHKGRSAQLEVYDKSGNHLGIANPKTGKIDTTKAVKGRDLKRYW
ncbi:hypothetical protein CRYPA_1263 [uncultured Candidatus Thioglobus sp.]|nr:hypothetical protein CRYPA_1263 [uncultured Candidatus Thioglobus sp.]